MTENVSYNENDQNEIAALLIGRRIVEATKGPNEFEGRLVLDDGTQLLLTGNDGGCACSAGCYPLESVATVDNVITSARVVCNPAGDDQPGDGTYAIFVFTENALAIRAAEFVGSDGNGYYGTGFQLTVIPAPGKEAS